MDEIPQIQDQSQNNQSAPEASSPKGILTRFLPIFVVLVIVTLGITSGLILASRQKSTTQTITQGENQETNKQIAEILAQTFKDEAEGTIQKNDKLDKYVQGTHKLMRPGGESQTAYLTSSVLDLDQYVGKKVKVFGETFGSSQVGWLMDVGKVEEIK